jgi:pyruvate dehydrogenase E2 component (dihydrolipoamide acetyltransferase)
MSLIEIKVPDIGDFSDVTVIELLVKVGDTVKVEQSLLTVESDKASMEIPSSHTGVVKELKLGLGDTVKEGTLILMLEVADALPVASDPEIMPNTAVAHDQQALVAIDSIATDAKTVEICVPDIGDFDQVTVIEIMVKVGDSIKAEQSLITVESDKASMEIPSAFSGVVKELKVAVGDTVKQGSLILMLEISEAASVEIKPPAPVQDLMPNQPVTHVHHTLAASLSVAKNQNAKTSGNLPHASPSVRKFARELGVPLDAVKGTGPKDRITDADIQSYTRSVMSGTIPTAKPAASEGAGLGLIPWPQVDFAKFGQIEKKELSRIQKISGANLLRNAIMIPAVTNHDDADITDLENFRVTINKENEKSGVKITMLALLIKACVSVLKKYPQFNSSLDGNALIYKKYYHIGFAADTPDGLMVPVIKDADQKGIVQISTEMTELAKKAREGKLSPSEMSGASFTISSLGGIGGRYFTPIINAPEVAILGVCRAVLMPAWDGKAFQPRLMLPLSLTWDHRVIDGAAAARFNVYLCQILGDFRRVLL